MRFGNLSALLADALELLRPSAEEGEVELGVERAYPLPPVRADRDRILQVFSNLVGNAIKFTPPGEGTTFHFTLPAAAEEGE